METFVSGAILTVALVIGVIVASSRFRNSSGHFATSVGLWLFLMVATHAWANWAYVLPWNYLDTAYSLSISEALMAAVGVIVYLVGWIEASWYLWLALHWLYIKLPRPDQ